MFIKLYYYIKNRNNFIYFLIESRNTRTTRIYNKQFPTYVHISINTLYNRFIQLAQCTYI